MPVVSGLGTLRFFSRFIRDPLKAARDALERRGPLIAYEPCLSLPRRGRTTIFATGARYNRAILGDPGTWQTGPLPTRGPKGSALDRLGENLVSMNGPRHAYYRKLLSQPLRTTSIEQLGDDIGKFVTGAVAAWPQGGVDLWLLAHELMRSVAVALLFGGDQARGLQMANLIKCIFRESKSAPVYLNRAGLPGNAYKRLLDRAEQVERCALAVAGAKRGQSGERDLVSLIVNSPDETGAAPNHDVVAGQIPVLFASTYETCQTLLTWTLFLLAQHPEIARDVADEVSGELAGAPPTLSRVGSLPLLNAVVKEGLRLLTPVPFQTRIASKQTQIDGHDIRTGTYVLISPFLTNRAPNIYDEPSRFKPERWSRINLSPFEYLAFSGGPRTCPGFAFGTGVVKVALAAILSRFCVRLVAGSRIDYRVAITMAPSKGLKAILCKADGAWTRVPVKGRINSLVDLTSQTHH
jgi:cytochrome P450